MKCVFTYLLVDFSMRVDPDRSDSKLNLLPQLGLRIGFVLRSDSRYPGHKNSLSSNNYFNFYSQTYFVSSWKTKKGVITMKLQDLVFNNDYLRLLDVGAAVLQ